MSHPAIRTCIIQPQLGLVSESFIKAHAQRLPGEVTVIHGTFPMINDRSAMPNGRVRRVARRVAAVVRRKPAAWVRERAFAEALAYHKPDVVLAEYGHSGVLIHDACQRLGIPFVVHFHGYDASRRDVLSEFREAYPLMFSRAAGIIAVSRAMHRRLLELGAPADRTHYIPYGIDCDRFSGARPHEAEPVLVAVGRLVEKKAPYLTLAAFAKAAQQVPNATLRIIGDGPLAGVCRDLARALDVADRVHFLGPQPHDRVQAEMRAARAFVQHSIEASDGDCEGTPLAVLEAGASGLAVIATRHAGIPDVVIEGQTGLLVDERDTAGMADCMVQLLRDPALAKKMGDQAAIHVRQHYPIEQQIGTLGRTLEAAVRK